MNWKRGFERLAALLSVLGAFFGIIVAGAIAEELIASIWFNILALVIGAIVGWLLVWCVYGLLQWIVLGFCDDKKNEHKSPPLKKD